MRIASSILAAVTLLACGGDADVRERWAQHKLDANYPDYCSVELCDDMEQGYEPVCECWCDYDADDPLDEGSDGECEGGDGCPGDSDPGAGCVVTQGYWLKLVTAQRATAQAAPWPSPFTESSKLCGKSMLTILSTRAQNDTWTLLAHQYIAASLNLANGAHVAGISKEVSAAEAMLSAECGALSDLYGALELAELLQAYNNGLLGVNHCGDEDDDADDDDDDVIY